MSCGRKCRGGGCSMISLHSISYKTCNNCYLAVFNLSQKSLGFSSGLHRTGKQAGRSCPSLTEWEEFITLCFHHLPRLFGSVSNLCSWINSLDGNRFPWSLTGSGADPDLPTVIHARVTSALDCWTFSSHRCLGSFLWLVPTRWCHLRGTNQNSTLN